MSRALDRHWFWLAFVVPSGILFALNAAGAISWAAVMWGQAIALVGFACYALILWFVGRNSSWLKRALFEVLWIIAFPGTWFAGSPWPMVFAAVLLLASIVIERWSVRPRGAH